MAGGSDLDELFEDMFAEHTADELEKLKARYATTGAVLEAPKLIAAKAKSMLWHYVSTVMPGGFKAQLVGHQPPGYRPLPRRTSGCTRRPGRSDRGLPDHLVAGA